MRSRLTIRIAAAMVGVLSALVAAPRPTMAQVAKQKVRKERVVKEQVAKVRQAGGEVVPICAIDEDSLNRAIASLRRDNVMREMLVRSEQRELDSIQMAIRLRAAIADIRTSVAAARERARFDSIQRANAAERAAGLALRRQLARGWYVGMAGGATAPMRDLRNGYTGGWNATLPVGWDASDNPWGVRTDVSVDHLNGTRFQNPAGQLTAVSGDVTVWSLNADVKLRAHPSGAPTRSHVYALGGIGAHRVIQGVYGTTGPNAGQNLSFADAKTSFGWNAGAGISLAWGPTELFAESRFLHVKSDLPYHMNNGIGTYTSFTPIVVGLQWF
jgi:opacity protein-like surface antigen